MTVLMAILLVVVAQEVPSDLVALWAGGIAAATALVTQLLKKAVAPLATAPDWVKAVVALAVSFASTKLSAIFGAPIPPDLGGFAAVVVNWAAAMGLHAAVKKLGVTA